MNRERLSDNRPDRHPRIERSIGILKDDLHVAPPPPKICRR